MSTEHAVTTKLCHWSNLQGGFLYHNSGERYVVTRWHRIFWSKHNVMFQYVLMVQSMSKPQSSSNGSQASTFCSQKPRWAAHVAALQFDEPFLINPRYLNDWVGQAAVNLSWWTILLRKDEKNHLQMLNFHEFSIARLYCQWANWHFCWLQCVAEWNPYFDGKIQFVNYYILLQ